MGDVMSKGEKGGGGLGLGSRSCMVPGWRLKKNFFSSRVTENWNSHVKNVKTVSGFKRSYKKTQRASCYSLEGKRFGVKIERMNSPRGPSGTTGSSSPSTQVNKYRTYVSMAWAG